MITLEYLRDFRVGPFTMFDTTLAFIGMLILSPILTWIASKLHLKVPAISWLWLTIPVSVPFHAIFQQDTPLMKILSNPGQVQFYITIAVLLAMTYMGIRKIKRI